MKKKILSCLLAVAMLATMFVVPVSATSTVYEGDFVLEGISYAAPNYSTDITVNVAEAASYYVKCYNTEGYNVTIAVNGETVNRRTGSIEHELNAPYSYSFQNEVYLHEGENTITVFDCSAAGKESAENDIILEFDKIDEIQYTASLLGYDGTHNLQSYTHTQLTYADPQVQFANLSTSEEVSFEVEVNVADTGNFIPALAFNGNANAKITVNGKSVEIDVTNSGTDSLMGNSNPAADYNFRLGEEPVRLNAGVNTVKVELIAPASDSTYTGFATGLRFYATDEPVIEPVVLAATATETDGVVTVEYTAPAGTNFDIIVANFATVNGVKTLKAVAAPVSVTGADAADSATINVGTAGDIYEVYIWDSLAGMKPLLDKVIAD